ncbi:hypothetical protein BCR43DRAFT_482335 [Syncephalastrum racemosum]|uniref:Uncharacterized protein n=1 Tax=Syncephalastrum racemosum TaxID=13706 RepID=A0A1X2HTR1_SYNRA|nr:hypothetical protein BCR43DRAFT_482335 [Syncephalastrum racemosum]
MRTHHPHLSNILLSLLSPFAHTAFLYFRLGPWCFLQPFHFSSLSDVSQFVTLTHIFKVS